MGGFQSKEKKDPSKVKANKKPSPARAKRIARRAQRKLELKRQEEIEQARWEAK